MNTQMLVLSEPLPGGGPGDGVNSFTKSCGSWCEWLTRNVIGIAATMERTNNDGHSVLEFQNLPLTAIRARRLENGVNAIGLTFAINNHERRFEITGVKAIQLERDAAGFPTEVQFVSDRERVVLSFTKTPRATPIYSGNKLGRVTTLTLRNSRDADHSVQPCSFPK